MGHGLFVLFRYFWHSGLTLFLVYLGGNLEFMEDSSSLSPSLPPPPSLTLCVCVCVYVYFLRCFKKDMLDELLN